MASATGENSFMRNIENIFNSMDEKLDKPVRKHLKNVYSTLALALMAAAVGAYVHVFTNLLKGNMLTVLGSIGVLVVLHCTPDNGSNEGLRLSYLMGFACLTGLGTGPLLDYAMNVRAGIVVSAFMATCLMFACFTGAALFAPDRKFLYLGGVLMSLLSTLFWMGLVNLFVASSFMFQVQLYGGLALMCGFVLYDTQLIMEKSRRGDNDYIKHSLDLFIDFVDMFRRLLIILADKEKREKRKN